MAYHFDTTDGSIVIDGWEKGIAESPHEGISDMRNVNIISVPGEAAVNFSTTSATLPSGGSGSVVSADAGTDKITISGSAVTSILSGTAIRFGGASLPTGVTAGTQYWVKTVDYPGGNARFMICDNPGLSSNIDITSDGTGTFTTQTMGKPVGRTYNAYSDTNFKYFIIDSNGLVWGYDPSSGYYFYMGNTTLTNANGNGIAAFRGYLFVFRNDKIDYSAIASISNSTWSYGWQTLNTGASTNNPHYAYIGQDDVLYYCDGPYIGSLFQKPGATLDPTSAATYTYASQALALPSYDIAQCLNELGTNLLIGGQYNAIYPWNRSATSFTYPILLAENLITRMVTVNTNTYIFAGLRGRIYITNGSQAQLYKKVPDHISNTVEPYFAWGDAGYIKNQLVFGVKATNNAGTAITQYGGVWAIDLDTDAIRLINKLSYATYAGIASVILPVVITGPTNTPAGMGLHVGWDSGLSTYGMDVSSSSPYTNSEAAIDSDLIPMGTFERPTDSNRIEYKLMKPMVSGESITLKYRTDFSQSYTTVLTDSTVGNFSSSGEVNWKNAQWLQIQAVLNSTASTPSYVRLKEIRIK